MQIVSPRDRLVGYLRGSGIEVGPGHHPFPVPPGARVRYVDRWDPQESRALFPELEDGEFSRPDIVSNLDEDRLKAVPDASQDFVILSHVLEHLANPLGLLVDVYRVLRPEGVALILLPDRHRTFDRTRPPTPLEHVLEDYRAEATVVEDAHVEEFLLKTDAGTARAWAAASPSERTDMVDLHRRRSIHVHCWDEAEFAAVLTYAVEHLGQAWELLDGVLTEDGGADCIEFGYVLRRARSDGRAPGGGAGFTEALAAWRAEGPYGRARRSGSVQPGASLPELLRRVEEQDHTISVLRAELDAVYATKLFRYAAPLRAAYGAARRFLPRR